MKIEIEICKRAMDYWTDETGQKRPKYHAQIKDAPGYWSCGRSRTEAIGHLIMEYSKKFNVKICNLGDLAR